MEATGGLPVGDLVLFWALLAFFAAPALEQLLIVKSFMKRAIVNAHSTGVPEGQVRTLWNVVAASSKGEGGGEHAGEGKGGREWSVGGGRARGASAMARADTAALASLVRYVRHLNTRESLRARESATTEELDRFTARELRGAIAGVSGGGGDGGQSLDFASFRRFFRSTGGMINLNRNPSTRG